MLPGRAGARCAAVAAAAVAVVAVAGCAPALSPSPVAPLRAAATSAAAPTGYPGSGPGTAAALAAGRWTDMAPAPVEVRSHAASVWTGRELLVWGGATDHEYGDGAAYDPATDTWRRLPVAPLSPRLGIASAWTGSQWFLWGGQHDRPVLSDGALYDPASDTWAALPPGPLSARAGAVAVWDGREVIVLGGSGDAGAPLPAVDGAGYDPGTRVWRPLPPVPAVPAHSLVAVQAVAAGSQVYAWVQWASPAPTTESFSTVVGITALRFDPTTRTWTVLPAGGQLSGISSPVWTGRELLLPASQPWRGGGTGPIPSGLTGYRRAPSAPAWTPLPHGPVDDCTPATVWTGAALVTAPVTCSSDTRGGQIVPGDAAAWDPQTNTWLHLPRAPRSGGDVLVWTGDRLLEWGTSYQPGNPQPRGLVLHR